MYRKEQCTGDFVPVFGIFLYIYLFFSFFNSLYINIENGDKICPQNFFHPMYRLFSFVPFVP